MLRNYLAAAVRNLFRNRAYAAINIGGLGLGFAALILIALFVRDELSYDRFFPEHHRIYQLSATVELPGRPSMRLGLVSANIAPGLKQDFPEIDSTTRLAPSQAIIRHGNLEVPTPVHWADPNFFQVFPMTAVSGKLQGALANPNGIVVTKQMARRLFGSKEAVGQAIDLNKHPMIVAAVVEDLPSNTHFNVDVFAPAVASFSLLTVLEASGGADSLQPDSVYTYARLQPNARVPELEDKLRSFATRHVTGEINGIPLNKAYTFHLISLADVHFQPPRLGDMKPPGDSRTLQALTVIAFLIWFVAASNFVSMMTARSARRAVEIGVRKALGASRLQIAVQFVGECLFYAVLAMALALIAANQLLPWFNGFLQREISFDFIKDPTLAGGIVAILLVTGLAAGIYPALILSRFRPSTVLKGILVLPGGSGRLRELLVILQFGTLIALIIATATVYRQTHFAMEDRLKFPTEQIFLKAGGCPVAFKDSVAALSGVRAVSCASASALAMDRLGTGFSSPDGRKLSLRVAPIDYDFFKTFEINPLAGRVFSPERGEDSVASSSAPSIILNESAARTLGFSSPATAVNNMTRWARIRSNGPQYVSESNLTSRIIGVIPDFSIGSVREIIEPTAYYVDPAANTFLVLRLDGQSIPDTMGAVRKRWEEYAGSQPFEGMFLSQYVASLYSDIERQSTLFAGFSAVAVTIAALGLLGLAIFTAEQRTREIGLRKVMGASRWDILRFLGWRFTRPVMVANVIAWPAAYILMRRWLEGFAYHIDLGLLTFVAASALALIIALATVSGHALLVAKAKPAAALRYE